MPLCCNSTESARSRDVRIHVRGTSSGMPWRDTLSANMRGDSEHRLPAMKRRRARGIRFRCIRAGSLKDTSPGSRSRALLEPLADE